MAVHREIPLLKAADESACSLRDVQNGPLLAKRNSGGEQIINYLTIAGQG
jgi:hypothetical protein